MNQNGHRLDYALHMENRRNFPRDELNRFIGKHIAFSFDGSRIVASGEDLRELEANLVAAGIDPSRVVFDYVDPPDLVIL